MQRRQVPASFVDIIEKSDRLLVGTASISMTTKTFLRPQLRNPTNKLGPHQICLSFCLALSTSLSFVPQKACRVHRDVEPPMYVRVQVPEPLSHIILFALILDKRYLYTICPFNTAQSTFV